MHSSHQTAKRAKSLGKEMGGVELTFSFLCIPPPGSPSHPEVLGKTCRSLGRSGLLTGPPSSPPDDGPPFSALPISLGCLQHGLAPHRNRHTPRSLHTLCLLSRQPWGPLKGEHLVLQRFVSTWTPAQELCGTSSGRKEHSSHTQRHSYKPQPFLAGS